MAEALIIDAVRTPRGIGKPGKGALAGMHPQHLGSTVLKAIAERAILIGTMVDELERRGLRRGLVTMCATGGMAPAIIIERV
jgi:acetyl-CoA acetyltransferase